MEPGLIEDAGAVLRNMSAAAKASIFRTFRADFDLWHSLVGRPGVQDAEQLTPGRLCFDATDYSIIRVRPGRAKRTGLRARR